MADNDQINDTTSVTIELLGKSYAIRCLESEQDALQKAAVLLTEKMFSVQNAGAVFSSERIAMITALNFANQYLQIEASHKEYVEMINKYITQLQALLDNTMHHIPDWTTTPSCALTEDVN